MERDSLALIATDDKGFAVGLAATWTLSEDKVCGRRWSVWWMRIVNKWDKVCGWSDGECVLYMQMASRWHRSESLAAPTE